MFHSELDVVVRREQMVDAVRQARHRRLVREAQQMRPGKGGMRQTLISWIGARAMTWRCKLLRCTPAVRCCPKAVA